MNKESRGTSFFLNFDRDCVVHQMRGLPGTNVRQEIVGLLYHRFIKLFTTQFPLVKRLEDIIQIEICQEPRPGFDNGEIYFWLPGIHLEEDFAFDFLKKFKQSIENDPIVIRVTRDDYKVFFYGWGFRYI